MLSDCHTVALLCQPTVDGCSLGNVALLCQPTVDGCSLGNVALLCQPTVDGCSLGNVALHLIAAKKPEWLPVSR